LQIVWPSGKAGKAGNGGKGVLPQLLEVPQTEIAFPLSGSAEQKNVCPAEAASEVRFRTID